MKSRKPVIYQELRVRINEEHYLAVKALAREEETTVNIIINEILHEFFDETELFDGEA